MENGKEAGTHWILGTRYFTYVGTCAYCYVALAHFADEAFEFLGLPSCITSETNDVKILSLPSRHPLPSRKPDVNIFFTTERNKCD